MSFQNPIAFKYGMIVLIIFGLSLFTTHRSKEKLSGWISKALWPQVIPEYSNRIFKFRFISLFMSLVLFILALARPQWGERTESHQTKGMDILFMLDLSNSMLSEDTPPSRLNRAQSFIKSTLNQLQDDRVGIIAFAKKAFLSVPLTTDFGYVGEMAETLHPSQMYSQGTSIGPAIEVGVKAFSRSAEDNKASSRALVLITDGEDFGEKPLKEAEKIKEFGASFFAVSIGTKEGAPIPLRDESGVLQTYKKDPSGKPILSRVNRDLVSQIAEAGGGEHIELVNPEDAAYALVKGLRTLARDPRHTQDTVVKIDRFPYFLSAGILFFLLYLSLGYSRATLRNGGIIILFFALGLGHTANAGELGSYLKSRKAEKSYLNKDYEGAAELYKDAAKAEPENLVHAFNEGTARAKTQNTESAISTLNEAGKQALIQGDYDLAGKALYNEGILLSQNNKRDESIDRLTRAIELAKLSNQKELEEKARAALAASAAKPQPEQNKDKKEEGDQEKKNAPPRPDENKKTEYKSGTVSKDVAESIMNDLSDREKQLLQNRLKQKKPKEQSDEKDW